MTFFLNKNFKSSVRSQEYLDGCLYSETVSNPQGLNRVWYIQASMPATLTAVGIDRITVYGPSQVGTSEGTSEGRR